MQKGGPHNMRLIEQKTVAGLGPTEVLILVRHGVDDITLTTELNQPLTEDTKPDIAALAREIASFHSRIGKPGIRLQFSNRLRAIETASIIQDVLASEAIPVQQLESSDIREVYQGFFHIRDHVDGNQYKPLVDAWTAWQQKLDACELLYRFGDPLFVGDQPTYPDLVGWFPTLGENQGEFSLRLYRFLRDVFQDKTGELQTIVAHQASCSRMQRILDAASKLSDVDEFEPGQFVRFTEKTGGRITIHPACGVVVKKPNTELALAILEKEIKFLESIV